MIEFDRPVQRILFGKFQGHSNASLFVRRATSLDQLPDGFGFSLHLVLHLGNARTEQFALSISIDIVVVLGQER